MNAIWDFVTNPYLQTFAIVFVTIVILARSLLHVRPMLTWVPPVLGIPFGALFGWLIGWLVGLPSKHGIAIGFGSQVGAVFAYELTKHMVRDILLRVVEAFKIWRKRNNG